MIWQNKCQNFYLILKFIYKLTLIQFVSLTLNYTINNFMKENTHLSQTKSIGNADMEHKLNQTDHCPQYQITNEELNLLQQHILAAIPRQDSPQKISIPQNGCTLPQIQENDKHLFETICSQEPVLPNQQISNLSIYGNQKQIAIQHQTQIQHQKLQSPQIPQSNDIYLANLADRILKLSKSKQKSEEQSKIFLEECIPPSFIQRNNTSEMDTKITSNQSSESQKKQFRKQYPSFISKLISKHPNLILNKKSLSSNLQVAKPPIIFDTQNSIEKSNQLTSNIKMDNLDPPPIFFNISLIPNQNEIKQVCSQQKPRQAIEPSKIVMENTVISQQTISLFQKEISKKKANIMVIQINSDDQQPIKNKQNINPKQPSKITNLMTHKPPNTKNMKFPLVNYAEQTGIKLETYGAKKQRSREPMVNDERLIKQIKQKLKEQKSIKPPIVKPQPPYIHINSYYRPQNIYQPEFINKPENTNKKTEQQRHYIKNKDRDQYHLIMQQPLKTSASSSLNSSTKQYQKPFAFVNEATDIESNLSQTKTLIQRLKDKLMLPKKNESQTKGSSFQQNVNRYVQQLKSKQQKQSTNNVPQKGNQKQQKLNQIRFTIDIKLLSQTEMEKRYIINYLNKVYNQAVSGPRKAKINTEKILKANNAKNHLNQHNGAITEGNLEPRSQILLPTSSKSKQIEKSSSYQDFISRRMNNQQQIDLGVLSLDEVVQHSYNRGIISQQLFAEFVSVSAPQKIHQFLKLFTKGKLSQWDFNRFKFTIMDHRRLAYFLVRTSPKDFKICTPLSLNKQISLFLKNLYELAPKDYEAMLRITDSISKLKFWQTLTLKYRHLSGLPVPILQPSISLRTSKSRTQSQHSPNNSRKNVILNGVTNGSFRLESGRFNKMSGS